MSDWSHGYDVSEGYTYGFYHQMAPDWLDLCAAVAGVGGPRDRRSGKFRYLDLGSGQGLGLCLLAAANPEAEFIGVDFLPEHISHSQRIAEAARLTNVRFVQADFIDLGRKWPADFRTFDYVVLHGIYTWVGETVRDAIVQCLRHATHANSFVYVGYNAQPGWLGTMPFQHITRELTKETGHSGRAAIEDSIKLFDRLLQNNVITFDVLPGLKARLHAMKAANPGYLVQEYLNEHWRPMWHSEVANELQRAELDFVAAATIADNLLPDMLPPPLKDVIVEQTETSLRQDLQDFIINQVFRLDIFWRPPAGTATIENADLANFRLRSVSPPSDDGDMTIATTFGDIRQNPRAVAEIFALLNNGTKSIDELTAHFPNAGPLLLRNLLLLLSTGALAVEAANPASADSAQRLNAVIARGACDGVPYGHLAAASLGSAIVATDVELMLLDCVLELSDKATVASIASALLNRLAKLRRQLSPSSSNDEPVSQERLAEISASTFLDEIAPRWRKLGVLA